MSKILLIEDDQMELRMYQRLFTQEGFELITMQTGEQCRQKAIDEKPDIILLDIMMPKVNGFEVLDVLMMDPVTKEIPVVMLTNLSGSHYQDEALRRGAAKYLIKSQFDNRQLITIINDIISAYKQNIPQQNV